MIDTKINIISISDIHFGHTRTTPEVIRTNMQKYLYPQLTKDVDILIISGDFFDTLLDMNGTAGYISALTISELRELCLDNNILLRVLRGTFTHDRHQNQFFNLKTDDIRIGEDLAVRVFKAIAIEWIESLGVSILYVPDDLPYEEPLVAIKECMRDNSYSKVDIASMHCYFDHLLPKGIPRKPHNCYSANDIIELVNGPILNGHIHTKCVYKTIFTNGSFDRLAHNEEGGKGFFKLTYNTSTKKVSYDFVVNEGAAIYKSILLGKGIMGIDKFPAAVDELIEASKNSSLDRIHLRVVSDDKELREAAHKFVTSHHKNIVYSSKRLIDNTAEDSGNDHIPTIEELPAITESTLPGMIVDFAKVKLNHRITEDEVIKELSI